MLFSECAAPVASHGEQIAPQRSVPGKARHGREEQVREMAFEGEAFPHFFEGGHYVDGRLVPRWLIQVKLTFAIFVSTENTSGSAHQVGAARLSVIPELMMLPEGQ